MESDSEAAGSGPYPHTTPPWALIPLLHYASLCLDSTPTQKHVACHTDRAFIVLFCFFVFFFPSHQDYFPHLILVVLWEMCAGRFSFAACANGILSPCTNIKIIGIFNLRTYWMNEQFFSLYVKADKGRKCQMALVAVLQAYNFITKPVQVKWSKYWKRNLTKCSIVFDLLSTGLMVYTANKQS